MCMRLTVALLIFLPFNGYAASFDCDRAETSVEIMICRDADLGSFDEILGNNYREILTLLPNGMKSNFKQEQRDWVEVRNNRCSTVPACIDVYGQRIVKLKKKLSSERLEHNLSKYSNMNQLIWDRDFSDYIAEYFSGRKSTMLSKKSWLTSGEVTEVLGGPPNNLEIHGKVIVGSACRARSCDEKGVVIIDPESLKAIFGVVHFFTENSEHLKDPTLSIFYKDEEYLNAHLELIKTMVRKWSNFKLIKLVKIRS